MNKIIKKVINLILDFYPDTIAIYLFGSFNTVYERPDSDVDIAVLLPDEISKNADFLDLSDCKFKLSDFLHKDVDFIDLRRVSTVFQKEIILSDNPIYISNQYAVDEFEMHVLSFYQKLNQERAEILEQIQKDGRVVNV